MYGVHCEEQAPHRPRILTVLPRHAGPFLVLLPDVEAGSLLSCTPSEGCRKPTSKVLNLGTLGEGWGSVVVEEIYIWFLSLVPSTEFPKLLEFPE